MTSPIATHPIPLPTRGINAAARRNMMAQAWRQPRGPKESSTWPLLKATAQMAPRVELSNAMPRRRPKPQSTGVTKLAQQLGIARRRSAQASPPPPNRTRASAGFVPNGGASSSARIGMSRVAALNQIAARTKRLSKRLALLGWAGLRLETHAPSAPEASRTAITAVQTVLEVPNHGAKARTETSSVPSQAAPAKKLMEARRTCAAPLSEITPLSLRTSRAQLASPPER